MPPAHSHSARVLALVLALGAAAGAAQAGKPKLGTPLNDTGALKCVDLATNQFTKACSGTGQDGESGRDVTATRKTDGHHGFSYAKVCNSGEPAGSGACPADPVLGAGANQWGCTQDHVTKLMWEVKTADGGLRDWKKVYTNWGDGRPGDASEFMVQANAQGLCGATDWRLPSVQELQGLVSYGVPYPGPSIAKTLFPHTADGRTAPSYGLYWTADGQVANASNAWGAYFSNGGVIADYRDFKHSVRLVRSGL